MSPYGSQPGMIRGSDPRYNAQQQSTQHSSPSGSSHEFASPSTLTPMASSRQHLLQGHGYQPTQYANQPVSSAGESSTLSPIAPSFQYGAQQYENVHDPTPYPYTQNPQYRQQGYPPLPSHMDRTIPSSSSLLEQPLTSTLAHRPQDTGNLYAPGTPMQQQPQYGEQQGYPGSYDPAQQRNEYPTPTTQSGRW